MLRSPDYGCQTFRSHLRRIRDCLRDHALQQLCRRGHAPGADQHRQFATPRSVKADIERRSLGLPYPSRAHVCSDSDDAAGLTAKSGNKRRTMVAGSGHVNHASEETVFRSKEPGKAGARDGLFDIASRMFRRRPTMAKCDAQHLEVVWCDLPDGCR